MSFFDKLKKAKGGYLFLSHSHADIAKVRKIRNQLEQEGFDPLCFYLKCLDDDSEIEDLIKREIDAREWFLFLNSENSRNSKWVTLEREYITKTNRKKILTLDIDDDKAIFEIIQKLSHNLRIFISYTNKDAELARRIKNKLEEKDYLVFFAPDSIPAGKEYAATITNAIAEASKDGCVISLITQRYLNSAWTQREIELAVNQGGNIIPIFVGDIERDDFFKFTLKNIQGYQLSENPTDEQIDEIINKIGDAIIK